MIKLIIFDAGDILYDWRSWFETFDKEVKKFLTKHNAKDIDKFQETWESEEIGPKAGRGEITLHEAHKRHLAKFGIAEKFVDEYDQIDKNALRNLKLKEPKIKEVIIKLKKDGYKVAVLSDTPHTKEVKKEILKIVGLHNLFDEIFVSSDLNHMKPDKKTYKAVLSHFNVKPEEAIFVGHEESEILGAKKLGIKTISYQGHNSGDFVVQKFAEIVYVVKKF